MKKVILTIIIASFFFAACNFISDRKKKIIVKQDTSINATSSFNNLFLDSVSLEHFIESDSSLQKFKKQFYDFYKHRNYEFAWFDPSGLTEQAHNFYNLQNNYIAEVKDSSIFNAELQHLLDTLPQLHTDNNNLALQTELLLTGQFFNYASKVYQGSDIDASELGWFIPRKKINVAATLDSMIKNKGHANNEVYAPLNSQYNLLEKFLLQYYDIESKHEWDSIPAGQSFKKGDRSLTIASIKKRLFELGDLKENDTTPVYDTSLLHAVKQFQRRYGLPTTGLIGGGTLKELNTSLQSRIQQILVNMERARWMPPDTTKSDYLVVNIPEYKLHVYEQGKHSFNMNVVVGTAANSTVIFTGNLKYIVFSPYWNVTPTIVEKEVLPAIKKDPDYLAKNNMEITGYENNLPVIRQKPGANNSLGLVKFLFPNSYNIYFHDTPFKELFTQSNRSFSHGCIRLGDPLKLASFLLRSDTLWTQDSIKNSMNLGKEKWITIKPSIPVTICYFTAWVDADGLLNFRNDIYGHDSKMAEKLFMKQ
jgi:murein L,D-transpeptidase YcbB/YkuD